MEKVIVLGGSYNPPTKGHLMLMEAAMDFIGASQGIFAPASHAYVSKKMKRARCPQDVLSENTRLEMLDSLCKKDTRLCVSRVRMLTEGPGYDYEMMEEIERDLSSSETELYFLIGSDKLYVLPKWHRVDELLDRYRILVARRGEDDLERIKERIREKNPQQWSMVAGHWDQFTVFDAPEQIRSISSTAFREKVRSYDQSARDMVTEEVWELMNANGKLPWNSITDFREEYFFLSNFFPTAVTYDGLTYGSSEAAFQAQKCQTQEEKIPFTEYGPGKSKGAGRRVALRPDWEKVKAGLMEEIVRAKFTQNQELGWRLLGTGEKILIEGNHWGDTFWGVDTRTGQGENHLGKILMKVREELKEAYSGPMAKG